eukprot:6606659-Alexandrium_andersonii.AAC.1
MLQRLVGVGRELWHVSVVAALAEVKVTLRASVPLDDSASCLSLAAIADPSASSNGGRMKTQA